MFLSLKESDSISKILKNAKNRYENITNRINNLSEQNTEKERILNLCPLCLPDGTGIFTPESWIKWAKRELGYKEELET